MRKYEIKAVPTMPWMSEKAIEVVNKFNACGKKLAMIVYENYEDRPLEDILDEGMYYYEYPDCPEAIELEKMIEECADGARHIYYNVMDLDVHYQYMKEFFGDACFRIDDNLGGVIVPITNEILMPTKGEPFRIGPHILKCLDITGFYIIGTFYC